MNVDKFVVRDRSVPVWAFILSLPREFMGFYLLDGVHGQCTLGVEPVFKMSKQYSQIPWSRGNVTAHINLRPPELAAFDWVYMAQHAAMDFQDVLQGYVVIPKD